MYDIVGGGWRLKHEDQVLSLSRLMLRAESFNQRIMILKVIQVSGRGQGYCYHDDNMCPPDH